MAFEDYIDYEIEAGDPARIQSIFERAIHDHCLIPRLWIRYTQYLVSFIIDFLQCVGQD